LSIKLLEIAEFNQIEWIFNWHGQPIDLKEALNLLKHDENGNEESNFANASSLAPRRTKIKKRTKKK